MMNLNCYICQRGEAPGRMIRQCRTCEENSCSDCTEFDFGGGYDGNQISQWICHSCFHPLSLNRVELALRRLYYAATDPAIELWYFNGLTQLRFIRQDLGLEEQIEKLKAQTPITVERRVT